MDRPVTGPRLQDPERNARELLARWSTQHLLEPPIAAGPVPVAATIAPDVRPAWNEIEARSDKPAHRFDGPHATVPTPAIAATGSPPNSEINADEGRLPEQRRRRKVPRPHLTPAEPSLVQPPSHDELVRMAVEQPVVRQANWTTTIGQLCAYGGVGVLTLGTVMVLSGYFGGPANYSPTGWLVAAVGQMLLFLGVVTLVSGGMEQTVDEVAWRIDYLAGQIMHLERTLAAQQAELEAARRREDRNTRSSRQGRADAA